jgi:hypothetical protein
MAKLPKEFLERCRAVTAKRPRTVIQHILKHGRISTEELKNTYGYNHPPRAARDVKEHGIPLERFTVVGSDGRKIAAYRFGDPKKARVRRFEGRTGVSKQIKDALIAKFGCRFAIYLEEMSAAELQIDHRVPYEVAGESVEPKAEDFMLLCGSANRAKSWSCEHCENWRNLKKREICLSCYWAYPEDYSHVAMQSIRRIDLLWRGDAVSQYERIKAQSVEAGVKMPDYVKSVVEAALKKKS